MKNELIVWSAKIKYDTELYNNVDDEQLEDLIDRLEDTFREWKEAQIK